MDLWCSVVIKQYNFAFVFRRFYLSRRNNNIRITFIFIYCCAVRRICFCQACDYVGTHPELYTRNVYCMCRYICSYWYTRFILIYTQWSIIFRFVWNKIDSYDLRVFFKLHYIIAKNVGFFLCIISTFLILHIYTRHILWTKLQVFFSIILYGFLFFSKRRFWSQFRLFKNSVNM